MTSSPHIPDKIQTALWCCRGPACPTLSAAARSFLERHPDARGQCEAQSDFDNEMSRRCASLAVPEDLACGVFPAQPGGRMHSVRHWPTQPAFWVVVVSLLTLAGYFVFLMAGDRGDFSGSDAVRAVLRDCARLDGKEFEPFQGRADLLGDWFFLNHGLEDFAVPEDIAPMSAAGCRVFQIDGMPVAQALFAKPTFIASMMRSQDFRFDLPPGQPWRILSEGEWTAALRQKGSRVTLLAVRGGRADMEKLLTRIGKQAPTPGPP